MDKALASLQANLAQSQVREWGLMPHVAARIFNQPLAILPTKLHAILAAVGPRLGLHGVSHAEVRGVVRQDRSTDYCIVEGVAVVSLMGTIVKRNAGGVMDSSGMISSEAVQETLITALTDPNVRAVLLQIDSYGGEVAGTADLANFIYKARGTKLIWGIADEAAYSAAYWIGSAVDRFVTTQNGGVGSVGVITIHVDESAADAMAGFDVSVITAGDKKADLSPFRPLSKRGRATLQGEVDRVWAIFASAVARNRGLDLATVFGWEAGCFQGQDAVAAGLVDAVSTFDETLMELATRPLGPSVAVPNDPPADDDPADDPDFDPNETDSWLATHNKPAPSAATEGNMAEKVGEAAADAGKKTDVGTDPAKVIQMSDHQKETAAARAAGASDEKARCMGIRELCAIASRGPLAKAADALGAKLIESGATVDDARKAMVDAQAKVEEQDGAILGHTAQSAEAQMKVPQLRSREDVLAQREEIMLAGRVGGRGVRGLRAPAEKGARA